MDAPEPQAAGGEPAARPRTTPPSQACGGYQETA